MKLLKNLVVLLLLLMFFGCASYSKKNFRNQTIFLKENNLNELNGTYSYYPTKKFKKHPVKPSTELLNYTNSFQAIIILDGVAKRGFDSTCKNAALCAIKLELVEKNKGRLIS